MIPLPHGGHLIDGRFSAVEAERRRDELEDLPQLWPEIDQIYDARQIGIGGYSPLTGFMDREMLDGVLTESRLPDGLPWTLPIVLTPPDERNRRVIESLRLGEEVALRDPVGRFVALLRLREKFPLDVGRIAREVYGTTDSRHPNIADLERTGSIALAGPIDLLPEAPETRGPYELTPEEMREDFRARGWASVAGYQTRNVPHRAHEYLQRLTLEREDIDGLLVHPVVGRLKPGDYRSEVVVAAYEKLIATYFPAERVRLATLSITMRYAGPRAALFLAIVRKNYGCSHYIVGRDQAGVGSLYDPYAAQMIFDDLPVGIVPLRYAESFYCRRCDGISSPKTCPHAPEERERTSQTRIRTAIRDGQPLPQEILRPEIAELLRAGGETVLNLPPSPTGRSPTPLAHPVPTPDGSPSPLTPPLP